MGALLPSPRGYGFGVPVDKTFRLFHIHKYYVNHARQKLLGDNPLLKTYLVKIKFEMIQLSAKRVGGSSYVSYATPTAAWKARNCK